MRSLFLKERCPVTVQLPDQDRDFLLVHHGHHLRLSPAQAGAVLLRSTRLVGLIVTPSLRLVIRPKLPLRSFAWLLGLEALPPQSWTTSEGQEFGIVDVLALRLARLVQERLAAGLCRGYVEHSSEGPRLRGRLDLSATLRESPRRDRLHSRHQDLSLDVPANQVLRSTLESLVHSPLLGEPLRADLGGLLCRFEGVSGPPLGGELFRAAEQSPPEYRPVLELCRLLARGLQPATGEGRRGFAFLLDLEELFERQVTRAVRTAFAGTGFQVEEQPLCHLVDGRTGQGSIQFRPDIVVREENRVRLVIDAKWKRALPGQARPADLYQILAYGCLLGGSRLALVHPGRHDGRHQLRFREGACLQLHTVRVTASAEGCERSLIRLGTGLVEWAQSQE